MPEIKTVLKTMTRPQSLTEKNFTYCPGCGHGLVHRIIAEVIDECAMREKTIAVAPVGCAVFAYNYFNFDTTEAAHGRPPAVATGIKRVLPDRIVFTYQGDGDLAAIGTAELIHVANRGENITIIFINNAIYGMTGGQMAPTTLEQMKTMTTQTGRNTSREGHPLKVCEILSMIEGVCYCERTSVHNPANIMKTKKAVKTAFQMQIDKKGFSLVEVLSQCPVNWGKTPQEAVQWVAESMSKTFPLKRFK
ncbi:MAG: 2-oxoglutarate oxidoreductase [Elusimicrobia bacterium]|nr:2-oxoglutarate oxidoreductase [Elusimicrobiota bacterium]MBD3412270.1 2-oxoglutarate oxidoreductase [Elusimicrobiota bacterium]